MRDIRRVDPADSTRSRPSSGGGYPRVNLAEKSLDAEVHTLPLDIFRSMRRQSSEDTISSFDLNVEMASALYSPADSLQALTPRSYSPEPVSPVDLSFEDCRQSISSSVNELLQAEPDNPIDAAEATPMASKQPSNIGTSIIKPTRLPHIEITSPGSPHHYEQGATTRVRHSKTSSPSNFEGAENKPITPGPDSSEDIWTSCRSDGDYCYSPKNLDLVLGDQKPSRSSQIPLGSELASTSALTSQQVPFQFATGGDASAFPPAPRILTAPEVPDVPEVPTIGSFTEISKKTSIPVPLPTALPNEIEAIPKLPTDATGQIAVLQAAEHKKSGSKKLLGKGRKAVQKVRAKVLRTPVLVVVVGKQLAGPTATALKMISHGLPIDPTEVTGIAACPGAPPVPV